MPADFNAELEYRFASAISYTSFIPIGPIASFYGYFDNRLEENSVLPANTYSTGVFVRKFIGQIYPRVDWNTNFGGEISG